MSAVTSPRSKRADRASAPTQLGLFDHVSLVGPLVPREMPAFVRTAVPIGPSVVRLNIQAPKRPVRAPLPKSRAPRLITLEDLPTYPAAEISAVERAIAALPTDRALLGYRDVQNYFGVSKATANRRMKEGLVPGVHDQWRGDQRWGRTATKSRAGEVVAPCGPIRARWVARMEANMDNVSRSAGSNH
jgi:hypothetical protein